MHSSLLSALLLTFAATTALAFPSGAPGCVVNEKRISKMGGKNTNLGFSIRPSSKSYKPGKPMKFTLEGHTAYKGLLLYVESGSDSKTRVGNFKIPKGFHSNKDKCDEQGYHAGPNGALTHSSASKKQPGTQFTWTPEKDAACETVVIHGVVATEQSKWEILPLVKLSCKEEGSPEPYDGDEQPDNNYDHGKEPADYDGKEPADYKQPADDYDEHGDKIEYDEYGKKKPCKKGKKPAGEYEEGKKEYETPSGEYEEGKKPAGEYEEGKKEYETPAGEYEEGDKKPKKKKKCKKGKKPAGEYEEGKKEYETPAEYTEGDKKPEGEYEEGKKEYETPAEYTEGEYGSEKPKKKKKCKKGKKPAGEYEEGKKEYETPAEYTEGDKKPEGEYEEGKKEYETPSGEYEEGKKEYETPAEYTEGEYGNEKPKKKKKCKKGKKPAGEYEEGKKEYETPAEYTEGDKKPAGEYEEGKKPAGEYEEGKKEYETPADYTEGDKKPEETTKYTEEYDEHGDKVEYDEHGNKKPCKGKKPAADYTPEYKEGDKKPDAEYADKKPEAEYKEGDKKPASDYGSGKEPAKENPYQPY